MRKRIIALALAVILCAGLQPEPVMAAEGNALRATLSGLVKNQKVHFPNSAGWHISVPLLNVRTMNDRTFMNNHVYKNNSDFSAAKMFTLKEYSSVDMARPESNMYLAYNNEYNTFNDEASWFVSWQWAVGTQSNNYNFRQLAKDGQLNFLINADLRYSRHMHWAKPGWHNRLRDYAQVVFYYNGSESNQLSLLMNNEDQPEGSWNNMSTGWKYLPSYAVNSLGSGTLDILFAHDERTTCYCGASNVRRPVIVFADTAYPKISSVRMTGESVNKYYYNSADQKITFIVNFNELIRRADGQTGDLEIGDDNRFKVKLSAYDRVTNRSMEVVANLVTVNEASLVFEYTIRIGRTTGQQCEDIHSGNVPRSTGTEPAVVSGQVLLPLQSARLWRKGLEAACGCRRGVRGGVGKGITTIFYSNSKIFVHFSNGVCYNGPIGEFSPHTERR